MIKACSEEDTSVLVATWVTGFHVQRPLLLLALLAFLLRLLALLLAIHACGIVVIRLWAGSFLRLHSLVKTSSHIVVFFVLLFHNDRVFAMHSGVAIQWGVHIILVLVFVKWLSHLALTNIQFVIVNWRPHFRTISIVCGYRLRTPAIPFRVLLVNFFHVNRIANYFRVFRIPTIEHLELLLLGCFSFNTSLFIFPCLLLGLALALQIFQSLSLFPLFLGIWF